MNQKDYEIITREIRRLKEHILETNNKELLSYKIKLEGKVDALEWWLAQKNRGIK